MMRSDGRSRRFVRVWAAAVVLWRVPCGMHGAHAAASPSVGTASEPASLVRTKTSLDHILDSIAGQRLHLMVTANRDASLERRISVAGAVADDSDTIAYHLVCQTPCTAVLPARDVELYRVHAPTAEPTDWFSLPKGDARVQAHLVSRTWTVLPRTLLYAAMALAGAGGVLYGLHETDVTGAGSATTAKVLGAGAATSLIASGVVWWARPKSRVTVVAASH